MGWYVHLHVAFACDENEKVADLASLWLERGGETLSIEAKWFLGDLSERTGANRGPKGGLSLWGIVGNYTDGWRFADSLRGFWCDILGCEGGPHRFERIVVIEEEEGSHQARAHMVYLPGHLHWQGTPTAQDIKIETRVLPIFWGQA